MRGVDAEALVADALARDGWSILARNWRGGGAELDLVVLRDGVLRFVEVKARYDSDDAVDAVSDDKQRRLSAGAESWLAEFHGEYHEAAFLVAVVRLDVEPWSIAWIDDAFDGR